MRESKRTHKSRFFLIARVFFCTRERQVSISQMAKLAPRDISPKTTIHDTHFKEGSDSDTQNTRYGDLLGFSGTCNLC